MKTVKIIGVPEHFNLPWHLAIEEGAFEERGIQLEWTDIPEGTGKMSQMLKDGETDLAIILTEGIVKSITEGNPVKIIQEYIASPLLWGIHVDAKSSFQSLNELENTTAAISRFGSGSHLMAYVQAKQMGWDTYNLKFNIINNLEGAINGLASGDADYFMWERFTTKPLVDKGTFRHLGNCPTPWPCFVLVGTNTFLEENSGILDHILEIINTYTREFKQIPKIDTTLANRYHQQLEDIQEWLQITDWSQKQLPAETLTHVQNTLRELNLIEDSIPVTDILK
ncbi:ABC-type nitrate/sulfonate/bicarbonate transport system, substrate-binding protein [Maribacter dokdonensis]|uniref:ABC-type nitrate/sulfonate/bicarbonate transport system, substrate-binding protein n=1 Tax=Maribacter dokdonensis TaxID=320912 RepID=A0A1H4SSW1_9FLAO|nr:substrate-binding domain-containing protein [Maribacter dokdonensis]SEC47169.1 ABC-type nitrate/sulfonate/bicarbonate transport system, substrate-binding protein [Maribacter dokdonensis]